MGLFGSQPLVDLNRGPQMAPLDVNVPRRPNAGDWFFSPDQSTTRGKLGLLGEYLMGASGGPLASLGNGLLGMRQQGQVDEQQRMEAERQAANDDMRNRYMEAQIGQMNQPDIPRAPAVVEAWNYRNSLPEAERGEFDRFYRPVPYQYTPEGIAAAGKRQEATSAAAAKYRAPTGGGGGAASTKPLPAASRAKYISEANAAIARGADPALVRARLKEMGVQ